MTQKLVVTGLTEFRTALKVAQGRYPKDLTAALKRVGEPLARAAGYSAPTLSGDLSGGYAVSVRGSTGSIISKVPYGAGAEWGTHGKWSGFMKYGPPGRFAWKALEEDTLLPDRLAYELRAVLTANGWFQGNI